MGRGGYDLTKSGEKKSPMAGTVARHARTPPPRSPLPSLRLSWTVRRRASPLETRRGRPPRGAEWHHQRLRKGSPPAPSV
ncbi:hypothetical protein E8E11_007722 [Didymella keratinophila]|nr:hypothetical protein E8E11_007722 [Didymella keratinophila]